MRVGLYVHFFVRALIQMCTRFSDITRTVLSILLLLTDMVQRFLKWGQAFRLALFCGPCIRL